jgi:protease-4
MNDLLNTRFWAMRMGMLAHYSKLYQEDKLLNLIIDEKPSPMSSTLSSGSDGNGSLINVGVVRVIGVMTRYGQACSYGTEELGKKLQMLAGAQDIGAFVIVWDTPGGEVNGTKAFADVIKNLGKPVVSFVVRADSAGYWGASQATEIMMENTADSEVGSIGVYAIHEDVTQQLANEGRKVTIIRADGSEDKARMNPYEEKPQEALDQQMSVLNAIRSEFIGGVKAVRPGIDESVFSGRTYNSKQAIKLGLADRTGTLDDALKRAAYLAKKQTQDKQSNVKSEEMTFFSEIFQKNKPQSAEEAEKMADDAVAAKDLKINELTGLLKERDKKISEQANLLEQQTTKIKELEPKANKLDSILVEHETNKEYVDNLKKLGMYSEGDANQGGSKTRSYEEAPWNK